MFKQQRNLIEPATKGTQPSKIGVSPTKISDSTGKNFDSIAVKKPWGKPPQMALSMGRNPHFFGGADEDILF